MSITSYEENIVSTLYTPVDHRTESTPYLVIIAAKLIKICLSLAIAEKRISLTMEPTPRHRWQQSTHEHNLLESLGGNTFGDYSADKSTLVAV